MYPKNGYIDYAFIKGVSRAARQKPKEDDSVRRAPVKCFLVLGFSNEAFSVRGHVVDLHFPNDPEPHKARHGCRGSGHSGA